MPTAGPGIGIVSNRRTRYDRTLTEDRQHDLVHSVVPHIPWPGQHFSEYHVRLRPLCTGRHRYLVADVWSRILYCVYLAGIMFSFVLPDYFGRRQIGRAHV